MEVVGPIFPPQGQGSRSNFQPAVEIRNRSWKNPAISVHSVLAFSSVFLAFSKCQAGPGLTWEALNVHLAKVHLSFLVRVVPFGRLELESSLVATCLEGGLCHWPRKAGYHGKGTVYGGHHQSQSH